MKTIKLDGEIVEVHRGPWRYETKGFHKTGYGWFVKFDVEFDRDKWNRRVGVEHLESLGYKVEEIE